MRDELKIIKLKDLIKDRNLYSKEDVIDGLYCSTLGDIELEFLKWNELLNNIKEIIYHD